jgi:hypothetical protein
MSTGPTADIRPSRVSNYIDEHTVARIVLLLACATTSLVFYAYAGPWGIIVGIVPMYLTAVF